MTEGVPPLEEIPADEFDLSRVATIVLAAMANQPDELYARFLRGDFFGHVAMSPFDESGMSTVTIGGLPIVRIHYSRLWTGVELDLVDDPPTQLPSETVWVDGDWPAR